MADQNSSFLKSISSRAFNIFNIIGVIIALIILISFACWHSGISANWTVIGYYGAGLWALIFLKRRSFFQATTNRISQVTGNLIWYTATYVVVILFAFTIGQETLLGMYSDWAEHSRSLWGFIRIFAPIIILTVGSMMVASQGTGKTFSKRLIQFIMVITVIALLMHGLVSSLDKWTNVQKQEWAERLDRDRLRTLKHFGNYAEPKKRVAYYQEKSKNRMYTKEGVLQKEKRYPVVSMDDIRRDGPARLIQVYLPDDAGQFSSRSRKRWVRLSSIDIVGKKPRQEVVSFHSLRGWKLTEGGLIADLRPGEQVTNSIHLQEGQSTPWLVFSPENYRFQLMCGGTIIIQEKGKKEVILGPDDHYDLGVTKGTKRAIRFKGSRGGSDLALKVWRKK
jgi:uncharacterized membrane protein